MKIKILVFTGYYLPGFKAGGPVKSVSNMIENLGNAFDFYVVTRDRDLGDVSAYSGVVPGEWVRVGLAKVLYVNSFDFGLTSMVRVVREINPNIIYLVSFFDSFFTIRYLVLRYFKAISSPSVIIAPQGEFSLGALKIKRLKKTLYLFLVRMSGLCRSVFFHASSQFDFTDIQRELSIPPSNIKVAIDLPSCKQPERGKLFLERGANDQRLHIVFLSRIVKMKNLGYALDCLALVKSDVVFDIYGPLEDPGYWELCSALILKLPPNVSVRYLGSVEASEVKRVFSGYDLFFFPSLGEGYGHVIAEALSVGTTILVSDKTPWRNLQDDFLGWDLCLDNKSEFVEKIEFCAGIPFLDRLKHRELVSENAERRIVNPENIKDNINMFESLLFKASTL